jgi:hypothetical protein
MEFLVERTQHQSLVDIAKTLCTCMDDLSKIRSCNTCMESYLGICTTILFDGFICSRCRMETNDQLFSKWNNVDPGDQPLVLSILTKVEMIITQVSPLLQVIHAQGGQYK